MSLPVQQLGGALLVQPLRTELVGADCQGVLGLCALGSEDDFKRLEESSWTEGAAEDCIRTKTRRLASLVCSSAACICRIDCAARSANLRRGTRSARSSGLPPMTAAWAASFHVMPFLGPFILLGRLAAAPVDPGLMVLDTVRSRASVSEFGRVLAEGRMSAAGSSAVELPRVEVSPERAVLSRLVMRLKGAFQRAGLRRLVKERSEPACEPSSVDSGRSAF